MRFMVDLLKLNTRTLKQNPLIMAEFEKSLGETDHDLLNAMLHIMQNVFEVELKRIDLLNYERIMDRKVIISAADLKKLGKFGKNSNEEMFKSLKKIRDTSITIRNFIDIDGLKTKARTVAIVDNVRLIAGGELGDGREQAFEIQFNEWFLTVATREFNQKVGNYTPVAIKMVAQIRSKHAKRLYEILSMQIGKRQFEFSMPHQRGIELFGLGEVTFGVLSQTIRRAAPKVQPLIEFDYTVHRKEKIISFIIVNNDDSYVNR